MRVRRFPSAPWLIAVACAWAPLPGAAEVTFDPVPASSRWPDAVEPGALRLACSPDEAALAALFAREALPFRAALVRRAGARACHLFYRPTVPGFRAAPDDDPVTRIFFDTDPVLYLAGGGRRSRGEPVGAMADVLRRIARPLDVSILLHRVHEDAAYETATKALFAGTPHRVALLERGVPRTFWWVQDYVKAGTASGESAVLVPRRIFEGRAETADAFQPLLAGLARQPGFVRSRLSWEGGDLQFARDPGDAGKLVLFYGGAARPYWAEALTPGEYEWVLGVEFGADRAVDLGGIAPHVDYFVCFLPRARAALVAVPVAGDLAVARAAVEALLARVGGRAPGSLVDLRNQLSSSAADLGRIRRTLDAARRQQSDWQLAVDPTLAERMRALAARACPGGGDCLSPASQVKLLEADRATFEDWIHAAQSAREEPALIGSYLDLVESQLDPVPQDLRRRVLEKKAELQALGFRVVEAPAFRVDLRGARRWPGVSYVNALVVDDQVFVPRFGLGEVEDGLLRELGARLPGGYSLVAIDAQQILVRSGGLHCLAGLVR